MNEQYQKQRLILLAALILAVILTTLAWLVPFDRFRPTCPFRLVTCHPCPFCGASTAYVWVVHGRFHDAFQKNPLGALFAIVSIASIPVTALLLVFKKSMPFLTLFADVKGKWAIRFFLAIILANWIYMIFTWR